MPTLPLGFRQPICKAVGLNTEVDFNCMHSNKPRLNFACIRAFLHHRPVCSIMHARLGVFFYPSIMYFMCLNIHTCGLKCAGRLAWARAFALT